MNRFVVRKALAPSCAFLLIVVAAACGGSSGGDISDPLATSDSGADTGTTSGQSKDGSVGASSTSSTSSTTSSSGDPVVDSGTDASDPDSSLPDSSIPDSGIPDSSLPDASGGGTGTYVSATIGLAGNPGTKEAPVKTIAQGIAKAIALGGAQTVFVAEGHYAEKVTLVEGVSLLGGHHCNAAPCSWAQDPKLYDSAIDNQDAEGVLASSSITKLTKLEGFRIIGKDGSTGGNPSGACITLDGSSPLIHTNTITPGAVSGGSGRAAGIVVFGPPNDPAGPTIDGNTISGGSGTNIWIGISLDRKSGSVAANAVAQITHNVIKAGTAATSIGLGGGGSAAATGVRDNDITGGISTGLGGSWGIQVSSAMTIDRNRINLDQANVGGCNTQAVCGGIASQSSTTTITNNVIFGARSAKSTSVLLAEAEGVPGPVVLNGNYLDGAGAGAVTVTGSSISTAVWLRICSGATCGTNAIIGRLRNDIFMGGINENRYGIYEEQIAARTAHPDKLDADNFFFSTIAGRKDALYHLWNGTTATDLKSTAEVIASVGTTPAPSNLFNVDPAVDTTFHLSAASTLVDKGTATDAPAFDFDGEARPKGAGIDIGPDESN